MPVSGLPADLVERLARLGVSVGLPEIGEQSPALGAVQPRAADPARGSGPGLDRAELRPGHLPLERAIPGQVVANTHGSCYVSTSRRTAREAHGGLPLDAARATGAADLATLARDADLAQLDVGQAVFLDTETTGLRGGSGTYAFLVGAGRFVGDTFQVRQFFMRDPSEEGAQLAALADWLADASGLVTFNGRSFDLPLLLARYAMQRQTWPLPRAPHLDLLPVARRLWRRRLPSCALRSLEQHVFGLERVDDVPGWLIPDRYLRYQADGDARPLVGVFQHNVTDILSLVSLTSTVARAYAEPHAALADGRDWLSLAEQYLLTGQAERAMAACDAALSLPLTAADRVESLGLLGRAAKRGGAWPQALAAWTRLVDLDPPPRLFPFEELAKYHEHRAGQLELAFLISQRARDLVDTGALRPRRGRRQALTDLGRRLERLERKLARRARVVPGSPEADPDDSLSPGN